MSLWGKVFYALPYNVAIIFLFIDNQFGEHDILTQSADSSLNSSAF